MVKNTEMRDPGEFTRQIASRMRGLVAERGITQHDIAERLERAQSYVSVRMQGRKAWSIDDLDKIAEMLSITGLELLAEISRRSTGATNVRQLRPDVSGEEVRIEDLYDEPSAAHPIPRKDVEGDMEPEFP